MQKHIFDAISKDNSFIFRHLGPNENEIQKMLSDLGFSQMDELINSVLPSKIKTRIPLKIGNSHSESEALNELKKIASGNKIFRSKIGLGYYGTLTPPVIQRNILENPGWYTQYTPYQAEIAQGRLEALLNFQTMVMDLTALPVSNASLLDEGTAAAEAMAMCFAIKNRDTQKSFFVSAECLPQTIEVLKTRAEPMGIRLVIGDHKKFDFKTPIFGALLQYPTADGLIHDYQSFIQQAHSAESLVVMAADILSLTLLTPPGELGADIAVGSTQRMGVPMGFGGPHAAYFATKDEYKRQMPGRIVGVSKDVNGNSAIRLALQTREQHIRRDKATSNICTSQVLLAVMAGMYAVYHGPQGIKKIAEKIHTLVSILDLGLRKLGYGIEGSDYFDTLKIQLNGKSLKTIQQEALDRKINFRWIDSQSIGVSLDETTTVKDLEDILAIFAKGAGVSCDFTVQELSQKISWGYQGSSKRKSSYLNHPVFNTYHSETEMLRYIRKLEARDLSLTSSMIPLGSCTMKLNATAEMFPVSWPEFSSLHPFIPEDQAKGYSQLFSQLEGMLCEVTGFDGVSLQPNAGSQGEYAGLLVIRKYHQSRGESHRNICLIPRSAHGTNPATAAMAGMEIVVVNCDSNGNIDVEDLKAKAKEYSAKLAALMVTYPSTHGVFEESISEICEVIHANGGQVYMDGANMNAQIGLCRPGEFGPDVCHLNLHKTFCIPHGGGGPGMGPIGVKAHLKPFLPSHPFMKTGGNQAIGPVSAAGWGSASILVISWMYIYMMGSEGLKKATEVAILNANYIAKKIDPHFPVLYKGNKGFVAHEGIFDLRHLKDSTGVEVEDVAKRLMDYGFHAPTVSFPVAGTLMVEPTESESLRELDKFCDALIGIRNEIREIEEGKADKSNNVLKNAPHTASQMTQAEWNRPYSREKAVFPMSWSKEHKFWPAVGRINNVLGDRNLVCACLPIEDYEK